MVPLIITLLNLVGRSRKTKSDLQVGVNVIGVDNLSSLQNGMYLVVISTGKEIFRQKVVLAK